MVGIHKHEKSLLFIVRSVFYKAKIEQPGFALKTTIVV